MGFRVRIEQFDREIEVEQDQTILECALFEGIDYPFACQQGQCGSCKSQLVAGEVFMPPGYNPMALPEDERARGIILACQAQPRTDCVVSVISIGGRIVHPERRLTCTVVALAAAGRSVRIASLRVVAGGPFNFEAGQHAVVTMPDGVERALGMASQPTDPEIEFHLGANDCALVLGTHVEVRGPYGDAYLHDEHIGPMLAVAEESDLAPMLSILATALAIGMPQRIHLYISAADAADHYCVDRLRSLAEQHANVRVVTALGATDVIAAITRD
ncbi:MAG: 2Fe-2S iron-sulfur cluster-binding protein, partial [Burkholderiales bacterium]